MRDRVTLELAMTELKRAEGQAALNLQRAIDAEKRVVEFQKDAKRWNVLLSLWIASTELHLTQDEDGGWSINIMEPVEAMPAPGKWSGDDPVSVIDSLIKVSGSGGR